MENSILNLKSIAALCILTASSVAQAGTAGMAGQWDFDGYLKVYDPVGVLSSQTPLTGFFDFDADTVQLVTDTPFFGLTWQSNGTLTEHPGGIYSADHVASWGATSYPWTILWEITQAGNTATVVTLDPDGDGIPGMRMTAGPFQGNSFEVNGTLTAVPLPAAAWLFGMGLAGFIGVGRRKSRRGC